MDGPIAIDEWGCELALREGARIQRFHIKNRVAFLIFDRCWSDWKDV